MFHRMIGSTDERPRPQRKRVLWCDETFSRIFLGKWHIFSLLTDSVRVHSTVA